MSNTPSNTKKFSFPLRFFHWTSVLIIAVVYASIWMRALYERGSDSYMLMMNLHKGLGLLVLVWLLFRLVAYARSAKPPIVPTPPGWQVLALKWMHGLLWGLMSVLPLSGWLMGSAKGRTTTVLGIQLPDLVEKNDTLANMLSGAHDVMGMALLLLVVGHSLMGFWHHFFKKDDALRRMV